MKSSMKTHRNPWSISIRVFCHLAMIFVTFPGPTSLQKDTGFGKAPLQRQEPGWNWLGPGSWRRGFVFFASVSGVFCYGGQGWCFFAPVTSRCFLRRFLGVFCDGPGCLLHCMATGVFCDGGVFCAGKRCFLPRQPGYFATVGGRP